MARSVANRGPGRTCRTRDLRWPQRRRSNERAPRETDLRSGRPAVPLAGKTAVLVDDGIATGSTMLVAVESARRAGVARVVVAVPVAADEALAAVAEVADAVVAVAVPARFGAVGAWYLRFDQVDDAEVRRLLAAS